jgi:predicted Zn-dependent peptidase
MESQISEYLGFSSSNNVSKNQSINYQSSWENDFKLWVIGRSYCNERRFKVDNETFNWFKSFQVARDNVELTHEQLFQHLNKKMEKLKLGLKSYKYFDQAKKLADNLGVVLNESILNESSSMALSIYNPDNLADLLTDEVEQTKEEKIAIAKKLLAEQQASLN